MAEGIKIELTPESFRRVLAMAVFAGPAMKRNVSRKLKDAGEPAANAAKDKVRASLPARVPGKLVKRPRMPRHTGLRENIARGVRVGVSAASSKPGVRIVSSARYLLPGQQRMNRTYNAETFHHPVFGKGRVAQHGVRWFYEPIEARKEEFRSAVLEAMQAVADELDKL